MYRLSTVCILIASAGCGSAATEVPPPTVPLSPTVQSVSVTPTTATLTSLGETAALSAEVRLSNGSIGTQTPSWNSSNSAVATVSAGRVTAVGNGQAVITAVVGTVSAQATITVAQTVASVRLLPGDTVIKGPAQLRGSALDARGNPVAGAVVQWQALTPLITEVNNSGALTPRSTGVARIRFTAGAFTSTATVRTVWNVTQLSDLFPLFEFQAATGQRKAITDVSQPSADVRATIIGPVWSYLESVLPTSGSPVTEMYFTTWPEIWIEFNPFCGAQLLVNQASWQSCAVPNRKHFLIPAVGNTNDLALITRFLARQFMVASHTSSSPLPWFMEGYSQWLAGGSLQGNAVVGQVAPVAIADFKSGDTQGLLAPLDTLMRLPSARYYENLPQRTPVAVRMAQGVILVGFLDRRFPAAIPAILARIRATPGSGLSNDALIQEILTQTGMTVTELQTAVLAYARSL